MNEVTIKMQFEKDTKNTYRYSEIGAEPTLYIQKSAFQEAPKEITVRIGWLRTY